MMEGFCFNEGQVVHGDNIVDCLQLPRSTCSKTSMIRR
jgi:hypothetical protein